MREIRTSGLTSGDGKRGVAAWPKPPRPSSTLQVKGRKRQVMVDTDGRGLILEPQPADVQDHDGAVAVLCLSRRAFPFVAKAFADAGYAGDKLAKATIITIEIVRKPPDQSGFAVHPRRWVVLPRTMVPVSASSGQPWSLASLCPGPSGTRAPWPS